MPAFVVARFDDGGVEVVSQNWLSKDQSVVRWPRLIKNAAKFRDCVISHEAPADSWTECRIERIYGHYGNIALSYLNKLNGYSARFKIAQYLEKSFK